MSDSRHQTHHDPLRTAAICTRDNRAISMEAGRLEHAADLRGSPRDPTT